MKLWFAFAAVCVVAAAVAADVRAPLSAKAPTLDGNIGTAEWANAMRIDGFGPDPRLATAYVTATPDTIYVAVRSQLPAEGELLALVDKPTAKMIQDDGIEIWIDPDPENPDGRRYQMMTSPRGLTWSRMHARGAVKEDSGWSADWTSVSGYHDGWWHCEMAFAIASLAAERTADQGLWSIDVWRNWKRPWKQAFMGKGTWDFTAEPTPVVAFENRGVRQEGEVNYVLRIANPTAKEMTVAAELVATRDMMPELRKQAEFTVAPGTSEELALVESDQVTRKWQVAATVTMGGGQTSCFTHQTAWTATGRFVWKTAVVEVEPLDFLFAFYPSRHELKIRADVGNLPKDAKLATLTAVVRPHGKNGPVLATIAFNDLENGVQEKRVKLPALVAGEYDIVLSGTGEGVPNTPKVKSFLRGHYPWEGQHLGVTDKVYPPFTPMQVKGTEVRTVLRRHELNDQGLWDQVEATAQNTGIVGPLLAAPMTYAVKVDGQDVPVKARPVAVASAAANEVKANAGWQAGPLTADAAISWDYDGMMRVDLTLQPTAGAEVNEILLRIPLRDDAVSHVHAIGDGIRNTTSMALAPRQRGLLWDATSIACDDLPANFCSYLYVGTPVRGLAWFAANDQGWSWDPATPNITLTRQGQQVVLEVRLVNAPIVIETPRTLTFGLIAAPVKPRLGDDWRWRWQRDRFSILGTSVNWGSFTAAASAYPPMKDTLVWEGIAKSNETGALPKTEVDAIVEHYRPYIEQFDVSWRGRSQMAFWEHTVRHNLGGARTDRTMVYYWNRATSLLEDEFITYQDEWGLHDWRADWDMLGTKVNHEIKIVPTDAFCDFHIYWYGKSFDLGNNRAVYWDNMFFRDSYNTTCSEAYVLPDGKVRPSTGIWGLRELVKRTFQYMAERGMDPLTMPHMTSTMILPVYSFATITYDLEWKYGRGPFQDKFDRAYTLMATNGELAGAWPIVLGDRGYDEFYTIPRSYTGCLLVHDVYWPQDRAGGSFIRPVRLLLQDPGAKAIRYWDEDQAAFRGSSRDIPWIVHYVPGKQALITLASYSRGNAQTTCRLDPAALGFTGPVRIRDAETFAGYRLDADSSFIVRIPRGYDVMMLEVLPE